MKKVFVFLMLVTVCGAEVSVTDITSSTTSPNQRLVSLLRKKIGEINTALVSAGGAFSNMGTGDIYYVDNEVGSDTYTGLSPTYAKATWDAAIGLCTANNGDVIVVIQSHAENCASAAAINCDVAGVTIIGLGNGDDMPEIALTAQASTVQISAADVLIYGIRFLGNFTNGVTECIDVTADGDGAIIMGCEFRETSNTKELLKMITLTADADRCMILNNRFLGEAGGTDSSAIFLEGGSDKTIISGNTFIGDWSTNVVDGTTALSTELVVANNYVHNADTSAGKTIQFHASTTGGIFGNYLYGNGSSYAIVADAMFVSPDNVCIQVENVETSITYYDIMQAILTDTAAADTEAEVADLGSTLVDNVVAAMDANSTLATVLADTAAMDTEAEWADLSSTVVDNIVAAMDANSTLATVLADTAAMDTEAEWADLSSTVVDNVVAAMDANSTLATVLADTAAMDTEAEWADLSSTVVDNIVAAIDANSTIVSVLTLNNIEDNVVAAFDANSTSAAIITDLAGISEIGDKVVADMDANSLGYWLERTVTQTVANNCSSDDLFDVSGGAILITNFHILVTEAVDSNAATLKIIIDRDDGAADTDFTTAVNVETDVLGTSYIFSNANPAVLTPLTPGASGLSTLMTPWFCPEGMIESVFSAVNLDGTLKYYMTWRPLEAGVTVTAQ